MQSVEFASRDVSRKKPLREAELAQEKKLPPDTLLENLFPEPISQ